MTVGRAFQLTELPWNRAGQTAQEVPFQVEGTAWVKVLHTESSKVKAGGLQARGGGGVGERMEAERRDHRRPSCTAEELAPNLYRCVSHGRGLVGE